MFNITIRRFSAIHLVMAMVFSLVFYEVVLSPTWRENPPNCYPYDLSEPSKIVDEELKSVQMEEKTSSSSLLVKETQSKVIESTSIESSSSETTPAPSTNFFGLERVKESPFRHVDSKVTLQLPAVKKMCEENNWRENAYLDCWHVRMGLMNAKNMIQTCFRLAMDAGLGMVVPKIITRDPNNLAGLSGNRTKLSYAFDEDHLRMVFKINCPQMNLVDETPTGLPTFDDQDMQLYGSLGKGGFQKKVDSRTGNRRSDFIYRYKFPHLGWWVRDDDEGISLDFHTILPLAPHLVKISEYLHSLLPPNYVGYHLRMEADNRRDFGSAKNLTKQFLDSKYSQMDWIKPGEKVTMFVASGDRQVIAEWAQYLKNNGDQYEVVDKWNLIQRAPSLNETLNSLDFDLLGVIDYPILCRANFFYGYSISSFSYAILFERGVFRNNKVKIEDSSDLLWQEDHFKDKMWK